MDTATISSVIDFASKGGLTLAGVVTVLIFLYVYKRTKSPHIILARLWLLLNGKQECKDPVIKKFLDEQSDLLQFRFITGIQATSVAHVGVLTNWCASQGETITTVAACGPYFDIKHSIPLTNSKLPKKKTVVFFAITATVLVVVAMLAMSGMAYDRALLRMKNTGTWFGINEQSVKPIGSEPGFSLSQCKEVVAKGEHPGFKDSDVAFICSWGQEESTKVYIAKTISGQRWLFFGMALFLSISAFLLSRLVSHASEALALSARIAARMP
jgi:hypothetical protein